MRHRLKVIALALIATAGMAALLYVLIAPTTLRIAVGPVGGSDTRVIVAFLQALQRERAAIRLKLVLTDGAQASARKFAEGKVDLAVVRSDAGLPPEAATVAIVRRDAIYFITRPGTNIEKFGDLRGKTVGMLDNRPANETALERILGHYGLAIDDLTLLKGSLPEIQQAAREGRVDAVFVVAPLADRLGRTLHQSFEPGEDRVPGLLVVTEAEALIEENPGLDTVEIVRGAFGGDPPRPAEAMSTLAVSHRLVARRKLDDSLISDLTRLLSNLRLAIVADAPAANQIELPSTEDRAAKLPIHPGTIAYAEGETRTFFERYGDWFYLGVMGFSIVGSVVAAFWSRVTSNRPPINLRRDMHEMVRLIEAARGAPDMDVLAPISADTERIRADLVQAMVLNEPDSDQIAAMRFLLDELEGTLARRRAMLQAAT